MIPSFSDQPEIVFAGFARDWFRLLARGEFDAAAARLDEPDSHGVRWSAQQIRVALRDYARSDSVTVTDPDLIVTPAHSSLVAFRDGRGYSFDHDMPLDGRWSDLTAQFEFQRRPEGYAVVLHDIHVL
jgi:hypothetical protein